MSEDSKEAGREIERSRLGKSVEEERIDSFRLETATVAVVVEMSDQRALEGVFPCAHRRGRQGGAETVAGVLNSGERFVPIIVDGKEEAVLINKEAILLISLRDEMGRNEARYELDEKVRLSILLEDTRELLVSARISGPVGRRRTKDFLNKERQFVIFEHDGEPVIINLDRAIAVEDID